MGLSLINMLGFTSSVYFAHITCYWKFFLLHYTHKSSLSTRFTKQMMPILRILCDNGSLVTWTVINLTTAKFKPLRAAAHQLHQDKHQHMRQKTQKLTSASWLRPVRACFHNLIRFNCAPFFASRRRHHVLTLTCLDACRCAAYCIFSMSGFTLSYTIFQFSQFASCCVSIL
jgi:hypothetical protein